MSVVVLVGHPEQVQMLGTEFYKMDNDIHW